MVKNIMYNITNIWYKFLNDGSCILENIQDSNLYTMKCQKQNSFYNQIHKEDI